MKVGGLFLDYDGTVAPLGVPREESRMFRSVEGEVRKIAQRIPVCMVTAKEFDFIHPRSRFAAGWGCVSGLDVRLADGRRFTWKRLTSLEYALDFSHWSEKLGATVELKRGPSGEVLGLDVDWTKAPEAGGEIIRRLKSLERPGRFVLHDEYSTFADFYAARPDKGRATRILKRALVKSFGVMFIGDGANDNSAFQEAEISIGVAHGQPTSGLRCDYIVEQGRLAGFLRSLRERRMEFTPSMAEARKVEG